MICLRTVKYLFAWRIYAFTVLKGLIANDTFVLWFNRVWVLIPFTLYFNQYLTGWSLIASTLEYGPVTVRSFKLLLWFPSDSSLTLIHLAASFFLGIVHILAKYNFTFTIETFDWLESHLVTCFCQRVCTPRFPVWSRHRFFLGCLCTFPLLISLSTLNPILIPLLMLLDYSFCSQWTFKVAPVLTNQ